MGDNTGLVREVPLRDLIPDARTHDDLLAYGHAAGYAMTRAGKTEVIKALARLGTAVRIVWNPAHQPFPGSVACRSATDVVAALRDGKKYLNVQAPDGFDAQVTLLEGIKDVLFAIGGEARKQNGGDVAPYWCTIFLDEVQMVAPIGQTSGPVHALYQRVGKEGVTVWSFSQDPSQMASVVIDQAVIHVLLQVKASRVEYLKQKGIPVVEAWGWVTRPYRFALCVGNKWSRCRPVRVR